MTRVAHRLKIPVEPWDAAAFVPAAASEAAALAGLLTARTTSVDRLVVTRNGSESPTSFRVTTSLHWKADSQSFATSVAVQVSALDDSGNPIAAVDTAVTTTWQAIVATDPFDDAAETFAVSFGSVDPFHRSARTVETALRVLGIASEVAPSDALEGNCRAVRITSDQPPMSSDLASPMNPYALAGIPGDEAERWADAGFPAVEAADWVRAGLDSTTVTAWEEAGFQPSDAAPWVRHGVNVDVATVCRERGLRPEDLAEASTRWVPPEDFIEMHGIVATSEMPAWLDALHERDLLDVTDVRTFVAAGLSPHEVLNAPDDLTPLEIIRSQAGDDEEW